MFSCLRLRVTARATWVPIVRPKHYPKNQASDSHYQHGGNMKTFQVEFRYQDRKNGAEGSTVKVDASSLPGAVAKATREFVKGLDRKKRVDMNKNGLEIAARPVGEAAETGKAAEEGA